MGKTYSLYSLLRAHFVNIPTIQRDYAHGRHNPHATDIRERLINDLFDAVVSGDKKVDLGFVYGRVKDDVFIPFDGQQRLTTVFLFCRYLLEIVEYESIESLLILSKFSYATRAAARDFCKLLTTENNSIFAIRNSLLELDVVDQPWFCIDWCDDPTVSSMLNTLQTIDDIYNAKEQRDKDKIKNGYISMCKSASDCPIYFQYLDMPKYRLSDDTYVTINARGKELSPWENFKASLIAFYSKNNLPELKFLEKLDGRWLDFFFRCAQKVNRNHDYPNQDDYMMLMIQAYLYNKQELLLAEDNEVYFEKCAKHNNPPKLSYPGDNISKYIPFSHYKAIFESDVDCLNPVFNFWDYLTSETTSDGTISDKRKLRQVCYPTWKRNNEHEEFDYYITQIGNANYKERVALYASIAPFEHEVISSDELGAWMRIIWNIIDNSDFGDNEYISYLKLVDYLKNNCLSSSADDGIYTDAVKRLWANFSKLLNLDFEKSLVELPQRTRKQVLEEAYKCDILVRCHGNISIGNIIQWESHPYLHGRIKILFDLNHGYQESSCLEINETFQRLVDLKKRIDDREMRVATLWEITRLLYDSVAGDDSHKMHSLVFPSKDTDWRVQLYSDLWCKALPSILSDKFNNTNHVDFKEDYMRVLSYVYTFIFGSLNYVKFYPYNKYILVRPNPGSKYYSCYALDWYSKLEYELFNCICKGTDAHDKYRVSWSQSGGYKVSYIDSGKQDENQREVNKTIESHALTEIESDNSLLARLDNYFSSVS